MRSLSAGRLVAWIPFLNRQQALSIVARMEKGGEEFVLLKEVNSTCCPYSGCLL